jgi:hypothetical protein
MQLLRAETRRRPTDRLTRNDNDDSGGPLLGGGAGRKVLETRRREEWPSGGEDEGFVVEERKGCEKEKNRARV